MADIEKILDSINLPKQVLEKGEALFKTLFGPSFTEVGGIFADQVKARRFNNQIKIFTKAQERLKKHNINPQKVSLKVLAPLIEYSSLEEEENLQDKWSNLISHILAGNKEIIFQQNCTTILNRISSEEAKLLDTLYLKLEQDRKKRFEETEKLYKDNPKYVSFSQRTKRYKKPEDYPLEEFTFNISTVASDLKIPDSELEFSISNLISLGLLKWVTDVDVFATKSSYDPSDTDIDVDVSVSNSDIFIFTSIGSKFMKVCTD